MRTIVFAAVLLACAATFGQDEPPETSIVPWNGRYWVCWKVNDHATAICGSIEASNEKEALKKAKISVKRAIKDGSLNKAYPLPKIDSVFVKPATRVIVH